MTPSTTWRTSPPYLPPLAWGKQSRSLLHTMRGLCLKDSITKTCRYKYYLVVKHKILLTFLQGPLTGYSESAEGPDKVVVARA